MSDLIRCSACGGVVVWSTAQQAATCTFCGAAATSRESDADVPTPDACLTMTVARADAEARFREWATASFFRPPELRSVGVELRPLLVPAWRFVSQLETHWAGLEPAATRSGKRPSAGVDRAELETLVPASAGINQVELDALRPFHAERREPFAGEGSGSPWEPPGLTRQGARRPAHAALAADHQAAITAAHGLIQSNVSALFSDVAVELVLLPIYIGAFRYRERPFRFLVNGQTGEVVGDAPLDRLRVALVVLPFVLLVGAIAWITAH